MTKFDPTCNKAKPASSQGLYVDESKIEELEQAAIERVRGWLRAIDIEPEDACAAVSFGMDSIPTANICKQVGIDRAVVVVTPLGYPHHKEYIRETAEQIGHDLDIVEIDWWTNEWLYHNRHYLFPNAYNVHEMALDRQQDHLNQYIGDNDIKLMCYGRRRGDNPPHHQILRYRGKAVNTNGSYTGHPIWEWKLEHVLTYMEMHGYELSPIYTMRNANSNANGDGPWHDREHLDNAGNVIEPLDSCWYSVYDTAVVKGGYDDYWHNIIRWFPQGHDMAKTYAARNDLPYDHPEPHPDEIPEPVTEGA